MKVEHKFMVECLKYLLGIKSPERLKKIYTKVEPDRLDTFIMKHNLGGLFYYLYVNDAFAHIDLPPHMIQTWKTIAGKNSIQNALNDQETLHIIDNLDKNQLDYVYIKGFSIRSQCYESDYIKASTDIDLLIQKSDYPQVKSLLMGQGYEIPHSYYSRKANVKMPMEEYEKHSFEISFIKQEAAVKFIVDLQWGHSFLDQTHLFQNLYNLEALYQAAKTQEIEYKGQTIKVFSREAEFINIAFHYAFSHGFKRMQWLIDICTYLKKFEPDINFNFILKNTNPNLRKIIGILLMLYYEYSQKPKMDKKKRQQFCVDKLLPLEYGIYKKMAFRPTIDSVSDKLYLRLVKVLLPYNINDRIKVIKYLWFNIDSIKHMLGTEVKINRFLLPFHILKLFFLDIMKKRK